MDKSQDKKHGGFLFLTVNSGSYANLNSEEHLAFFNATVVLVEEFLRCEKPQSNNNFSVMKAEAKGFSNLHISVSVYVELNSKQKRS